ncbi:MAG: tRNA (adenosine(37)-N6)-threonylcarbamoyltransferase complex transferase subunit TsaD [Candidatus Omnitrophota bacterium]
MIVLGIESSCDETAASLVEDGRVLSNEVSSSVELHEKYGGVVPEIASRFHVEYIHSVVERALSDAGKNIGEVDQVSYTMKPGLPGSLLIGKVFAQAISCALNVPLIGVDHLHAHVISSFIDEDNKLKELEKLFPFLALIVSGGHTSIYHFRSLTDFIPIARTKDDAIGEAFDKVSKMLGLGYPGGPIVEKMSEKFLREKKNGKKAIINFPRALLKDRDNLDFSFSGIKTAVLYHWNSAHKTEEEKERICYSFQEAVVDVVREKVARAIKATKVERLAVGGGVICNKVLRSTLSSFCEKKGYELFVPRREYCADNAAMVALLGEKLAKEFIVDS